MGSLGMQEIIVIFILALIVFGPRKLPEIGKTLGRSLAEFRKAANELRQTWESEARLEQEKEEMPEILKDSSIKPPETPADTDNSVELKEKQIK